MNSLTAGCGCGKKRPAPEPRFKVRWPDGTVKIFSTKIEAQAKIAAKPGGTITTTR